MQRLPSKKTEGHHGGDALRQLAQIIRVTTEGTDIALQTLGDDPDGVVLIDQSGE